MRVHHGRVYTYIQVYVGNIPERLHVIELSNARRYLYIIITRLIPSSRRRVSCTRERIRIRLYTGRFAVYATTILSRSDFESPKPVRRKGFTGGKIYKTFY